MLFGLGIASWMVHESNKEKYYSDIGMIYERAMGPINARIDSWTQKPFVDAIIVDASQNPLGCPNTHPEELVYEVWPGITGICDCLEREEDRGIFLHIECEKGNKEQHKSDDCLDLRGRNPIV